MPWRYRLLVGLALAALLLHGCSPASDENKDEEAAGPRLIDLYTDLEPGPGGIFIEGSIGDASNLIPGLASDNASSEVVGFMFVAPLKYDKDLEIVPFAAESYEVLDGGKRLRFVLRKGIYWDDGVELTAEDMEFTYKFMIDPNTPTPYAENMLQVKEFKVIDRYTFEATYEEVYARSLITWMTDILPKHIMEGQDPLKTEFKRNPVGCGPYRLKRWDSGEKIILEARDEYFEGRPNLDEITIRVIPDLSTMFLELKADGIDQMALTPRQYLFQTVGGKWDRDYVKYKYLSSGYTYLGYNLRHPIFESKKVRQALTHAVDKEEIVKGVLLGEGMPTIGPYKPGTWPYNENIKDYPYDPEKAKAMLAEEGWEDHDGDGVLDKDGRDFAFTILTNQGNNQRIATATILQYRFKQIGINVKIRTVEWATFLEEFVDKGRFDAVILSWSIPPDPDGYNVWHSSRAEPGGLNFIYYKSDKVDELLEKGRRTLDQAERKKYYDELQEVLHEDQPYTFLYSSYVLPIVHARFRGIKPAPAGISYNFNDWWSPEPLRRQ